MSTVLPVLHTIDMAASDLRESRLHRVGVLDEVRARPAHRPGEVQKLHLIAAGWS